MTEPGTAQIRLRVSSVHWTRIDCSSLADDAGGPLRGEDSDWIVDGKSTA